MNLIISKNPNFTSANLDKIKYGLEGVYILVTKLVVILFLSILLNIFFEVVLFLIIYNFIKAPSFGLHATKTWICLLSSSIIFLGVPIVAEYISLPLLGKSIISIITILLIYKNTPADTYKRPIINKKKRKIYNFISTIVAIIFGFLALIIQDNFISNLFVFSLIVQSILTAPLTYKLFKLPYNNYLKYV